jgi:hypothetical protein
VKGAAWLLGARQMGVVAEGIERQSGQSLSRRSSEQAAGLQREYERIRPFYERALVAASRGEPLPADMGLAG